MDPIKAERDQISNNEIIKILSTETDEMFLTAEGVGYVYIDPVKAEGFVSSHEFTKKSNPLMESYSNFKWKCVSLGISKVILDDNTDNPYYFKKDLSERKYCNPELNRNLFLLIETKDKNYLDAFGTQHFIVPVKVRNTKHGPEITYGIIRSSDEKAEPPYFYLAFSDMDQFNFWREKTNSEFSPVEMEFWSLKQIIGDKGICINPGQTGELFLTADLVQLISFEEPQSIFEAGMQVS